MNRFCLTCAAMLLFAMPASSFELGGEYFLVKDKTIAALQFGGPINRSMDISGDLGFVFSDHDESAQGATGSFLGSLFGLHLLYKTPISQGLDARFGGGFDLWPLYGIHSEEMMGGLVFVGEIRGQIALNTKFFLRSRYYLLRNEGLQPGVDRAGNESAPLVWSTGIMWRF